MKWTVLRIETHGDGRLFAHRRHRRQIIAPPANTEPEYGRSRRLRERPQIGETEGEWLNDQMLVQELQDTISLKGIDRTEEPKRQMPIVRW